MISQAALTDSEADVPSRNRYRLIVLGSLQVGKTAIVNRFLYNKFEDRYMPTIENFYRKIYRIKGELYMLEILDTSGYNPFPAMKRVSLQTGDLFVIVFSLTSPESFSEAKNLRQQINEAKRAMNPKNTGNSAMIILGNKSDLCGERIVPDKEIMDYINSQKCDGRLYFETSAKEDCSVEAAFIELFAQADIPTEFTPSYHRRLSPSFHPDENSQSSQVGLKLADRVRGDSLRHRFGSFRRRFSNIGMMSPVLRRPSLRSDLNRATMNKLVLNVGNNNGASASQGDDPKRCVIL